MKVFITVQSKVVPVYVDETNTKKKLSLLEAAINRKLVTGRKALKACLENLISIEIVDSEAILHAFKERQSFALSLY